MPLYRIRPGGSFRLQDGALKEAGDTIELDTDVATTHAGMVELVPDDAAEQPSASTDAPKE